MVRQEQETKNRSAIPTAMAAAARLILRASEQFPLERLLVHAGRALDQQLPDAGSVFAAISPRTAGSTGVSPPTEQFKAAVGHRFGDDRLRLLGPAASCGRKTIATPSSPAGKIGPKKPVGIWVSRPAPSPVRASAPTPPRWVRLTSPARARVTISRDWTTLDIHDKSDAARVMLEGRVIEGSNRSSRWVESVFIGLPLIAPGGFVPFRNGADDRSIAGSVPISKRPFEPASYIATDADEDQERANRCLCVACSV